MNKNIFAIYAEEQLKALIEHGAQKDLLEQIWDNVVLYAKDCQNNYIRDMKQISTERLTLLYNTYFIEKKNLHNCVYFVKDNNTGKFKIGVSAHPLRRIQQLRKQYDFVNVAQHDLELIGCVYAPCNAHRVEKFYHVLFGEYREKGEWFNIPQKELEDVFSERLLDGMTIKIKYDNGLFQYDGFGEVTFTNINKELLTNYAIDNLCNRKFITNEVPDTRFFRKICQVLNDYHGNHIRLFELKKPKSFELYEWLVEDNLIELAKNGDIGFIEDYYLAKKVCLSEYFKDYRKH